ncbi:nitroreductase family deazaflavin-dependent oxidoreductase [Cryptosporangium aurantiacum]|uniref:Deazaflavin-dependent oxidoreductase, nitroreductase family n=1 Tax=Cryptosporangium aurantiacum TaxID=134849 RepID=A0A1M7R255_9ACTN|nr:nitroreductase family deazaflavin-dependent oxidoreductase [Cryptosporangium aurantiacum]SHN38758.1 deazaflavin-dependent oxidoreductase, nitroreductase family [Cryptosporangium aurantiacum]
MGLLKNLMIKLHRRSGDRFMGMNLLYLTTVGAKSGQKRQSPVARFADGDDAWLIAGTNGGKPQHPAWYHNIKAHPDQVWFEYGGQTVQAQVEELDGTRRDEAWQKILVDQPRFDNYRTKTDRVIPILRITPV